MKKFQFELEEILNIRKFEQQQAEIELGKALASENEIQSKLNALAMQQASVVRNQSECLLNELAKAKLISDEKRSILKEAMQKVDSLEKLKEQQLEEYKAALIHEEDNELDDIVTSRFNPNQQ